MDGMEGLSGSESSAVQSLDGITTSIKTEMDGLGSGLEASDLLTSSIKLGNLQLQASQVTSFGMAESKMKQTINQKTS